MKNRITVIITTYKSTQNIIERSIKSVLNQSVPVPYFPLSSHLLFGTIPGHIQRNHPPLFQQVIDEPSPAFLFGLIHPDPVKFCHIRGFGIRKESHIAITQALVETNEHRLIKRPLMLGKHCRGG